MTTRILHISDLHFGWPAIPEQANAVEALAQSEPLNVVAISGDLAQRARAGEFQRAAVFLRDLQRPAPGHDRPVLITVPGNHDVAWWFAPLGVGDRSRLYAKYQRYISRDLEPMVSCTRAQPSSGSIRPPASTGNTLTWNPRDLWIRVPFGAGQLSRAADRFVAHRPETRGSW